jgi:CPA1 family monovalent cation:H+ antiporter
VLALGFPARRCVQLILGITGMRGAISLAAALAIPLHAHGDAPLQDRNEVIFLTYCAILITLVVPALALPRLLRRLGLAEPETVRREEQAACSSHKRRSPGSSKPPNATRPRLRDRAAAPTIRSPDPTSPTAGRRQARRRSGRRPRAWLRLRQAASSAERERLDQLRRDGQISEEAMRHLRRDLDLEESRLAHTHG